MGSFVHALLLDKKNKYKIQYITIGISCTVAMAAVTAVIGQENLLLSSILLFFLGVSQLPIIGVAYSFCAELTYPVNEALSCGVLQMVGSIVASVLTFAVGYLLDGGYRYPACYILIGSCAFGAAFTFLIRENLRRTKAGLKSGSFSFNVGNQSFQENEVEVKDASDEEYSSRKAETAPLLD
jgi:MFS family permease